METLNPIDIDGLTAKWENFRLVAYVFGVVAGALVAIVVAVAEYKIRYELPARLKISKAQQLEELSAQDAYHWPTWYFREHTNWKEIESPALGDRVLFIEQVEALPSAAVTTQFVLKSGDHSEMWGEKHVLGAQYRWLSGQHAGTIAEPVQFGDSQVSVRTAIEGTKLARVVRGADSDDELDVIGVGLESFPSNDDDPKRKLSRRRGRDLAVAAKHTIDSIDPTRQPSYRSLGLGRAMVETTEGSPEDQQQRRLVLIVSARKDTLRKDQAIQIILQNVKHPNIDLSIYEFSQCPEKLLSGPVNFDSGGGAAWLENGPTVNELCE